MSSDYIDLGKKIKKMHSTNTIFSILFLFYNKKKYRRFLR